MKRAATILLAGVILVSCGAVAAADQSLVSKSYLDGTFTDQALEEAAGRLEKLTQTTYDTALGQLNAAHSQALAQAGAAEGTGDSAGLTDRVSWFWRGAPRPLEARWWIPPPEPLSPRGGVSPSATAVWRGTAPE